MTREPERLGALIALWLCLVLASATAVQARTVAILFDTSGSMEERYQLPSFGAQMLAATIDGRAGFDRLLVMTFNEYNDMFGGVIPGIDASVKAGRAPTIAQITAALPQAIREITVTNGAAHQALMDQLRGLFRFTDAGTPYGPIEVMLNRIADGAGPGDEVVFVLVTDGEYNNEALFRGGALVPAMRAAFEQVRERITAQGAVLSVQYLFIDDSGGSPRRELVREQGVRDTLLSVFNGDPARGARYVSGEVELWDALQDIIAEVSGTDRAGQSAFIDYRGNTISLNTPLSVSRVVIVSTGRQGAVPQRVSDSFGQAPSDSRIIRTGMTGTDAAFGNPPPRAGLVEHLYFQRAVPRGDYELVFDAPVHSDVFLLFETSAAIELAILDAAGRPVPATNGVHRLFLGQDYDFRAQLLDGQGTPAPVDFASLPPGLSFSLTLSDGSGPDTMSMQLDDATDTAGHRYAPRRTGEIAATARASTGVLLPRSDTLRIEVLDSSADLIISPITPTLACGSCAADEIAIPQRAQTGQSGQAFGAFSITAHSGLDGQISLGGSTLPPGTEIRDQDGRVVDPDAPIDFTRDTPRRFTLWRTRDASPRDIAEGLDEIVILATPTGQWGGAPARRTVRPRVDAPEMRMTLTDVTQPITPGRTDGLRVPAGELLRGQFAAQYTLVDLLAPPDRNAPENRVSVRSQGAMSALVDLRVAIPDPAVTGFNALEIRPFSRFWCLCWIWGANTVRGSDIRDVTVSYDHEVSGVSLQKASVTTPFQYAVPFVPVGGLSCALNLLYLALVWIVLRGVWALFTTHRFPRRAVVEILRGNAAPSYRRLDTRNSVWWKAWFAAFTGNPDETRTIEGLRLRATRKGAVVDVSRTVPPWRIERLDASFHELRETQPRKTEHRLIWGDRLDSVYDPTLSLRLKRKSGD